MSSKKQAEKRIPSKKEQYWTQEIDLAETAGDKQRENEICENVEYCRYTFKRRW